MNTNPTQKTKILSVSQLTKQIKENLEAKFMNLWVSGEISNCKQHMRRHTYFSLKDEQSVIRGVFFSHQTSKLRFQLQDGLKVIIHGSLSVYGKQGSYQIIGDHAEPQGLGPLQLAFNQLKEKLSKEGLFDKQYKKKIPPFPKRIGIVTSPSGAAVRDILNILKRRFSNVDVFIYPSQVQGEKASAEIAQYIRLANQMNLVDVLIVGRGGGSIEDLWAFNEEIVARAIFESTIPIISSVGHEIDYTIADYVADLRVPTPSAAAELVVESKDNLNDKLEHEYQLFQLLINKKIENLKKRLHFVSDSNLKKYMTHLVDQSRFKLDSHMHHLDVSMQRKYQNWGNQLNIKNAKLNMLNPYAIMQRGYSISFIKKGQESCLLKSSSQVKHGDSIEILLHQGVIQAQVNNTTSESN